MTIPFNFRQHQLGYDPTSYIFTFQSEETAQLHPYTQN